MREHIWAKQAIWLWLETTSGTAVEVNHWIAKTWGWLNPEVEYKNDESWIGTIVTVRDSRKTKNWSKLDLEWILTSESLWLLLLSTLWKKTTTSSNWTYIHKFEIDEVNTHPSLTVIENDDVVNHSDASNQATYMMIDNLEIEANAWEYATLKASLIWRWIQEVAKQNTNFENENKFSFDDVSVKIVSAANKAAAVTALSSAAPLKLNKVRIALNKNLMQNQELGSLDIANIFNQNFTIEWDFESVYRDKWQFDIFDDWIKKYIEIEIKNLNKVIGTAQNPTLKIFLNQVSFQTWSKSTDVNAIVTQTVGFVWEYNTTDWEAISITLQNLITDY